MRHVTAPASRRDQLAFVVGSGISVAGDFFALTALILAAHDATQTSWAVAGVLLAAVLPTMFAARFVGPLVDRRHPAQVMIAAAIGQAVLVAALAGFATNLAVILALALLGGVGAAIARPAVFVLTPKLFGTDEQELSKANARVQFGRYLGIVGGEAAAGVTVAAIGLQAALLVDAASFLVLAALYLPLLRVGDPAAEAAASDGDPAGSPTRDRWFRILLVDNPVLLVVLVVASGVTFFGGISHVADVFLAKDVLGAGDAGFGVVQASWTAGVVVGLALLASRLPTPYLLQGLLVAGAVAGAATVVAGFAPTIGVVIVAYLIGGTANAVGQVAVRTLMHTQVPQGRQGQAYSGLVSVLSTADVASLFAGGVLVGPLGARGTIVLDGVGILAAVALGVVLMAVRRPLQSSSAEPEAG